MRSKVLVIHDDIYHCTLLECVLTHAGCEVASLHDTDAAETTVATCEPDPVIFAGGSNRTDVCIRRLRRKIETAPERPTMIETIRNVGYRFRSPASAKVAAPSWHASESQLVSAGD